MDTRVAASVAVPPVVRPERHRSDRAIKLLGLVAGLGGVAVVALLSLRIGSLDLSTQDAWNAVFNFDPSSYEQTVVRELRLPRTIVALGVGASLAVAGATMQAVTRNPLADPCILGVSSGAGFAIVTAVYYGALSTPRHYIWFAFAGALAASALGAWTSALLLLDEATLDTVRFWLAGSVVGRDMPTFWLVSPALIGGALLCLLIGHQLNVLNLGEETARALGMHTGRVRLVAAVIIVLITGAAVAVAGPIGFVGLAVPHMVRAVVGVDYRWVLPYSFVCGAIFLTAADIAGRVIARPAELQVGIVTAFVGVPFLIYLARRRSVADA